MKTTANKTYIQSYSNIVGVDFTSDPALVARNRLAYCVNMWRDYDSENGAAIETFPGFRSVVGLADECGEILKVYHFKVEGKDYLIIHATKGIFAASVDDIAESAKEIKLEDRIDSGVTGEYSRSVGFVQNNRLYVISNLGYYCILYSDSSLSVRSVGVFDSPMYIPTTYYNGKMYEQRNMLVDQSYQIETVPTNHISDGLVCVYPLEKVERDEENAYFGWPIDVGGREFTEVKGTAEITGGYKFQTEWDDSVNAGKKVLRCFVFVKDKVTDGNGNYKTIKIKYHLDTLKFGTVESGKLQSAATLEYDGTSVDAILGCTKVAIYDGRVFLTGNPALPNTVFYSARNSTGANDPTYFGVYNYFNDGYGDTPNVDMLSTPSMLMVIKQNIVQDGSIYYHQGIDNTDEDSKNLIPRIYPSTSGAAGLGSVGTLESRGALSCNFLDDVVFLTKRGLDGVSKQTVNLERTIGHRSTFVDKLLTKENLSKASMAEWKGYLVICCNGHIYLADSRSMSQTADGSYQYEWFYLEGLATRSDAPEYAYSNYSELNLDDYFINSKLAGQFIDDDCIVKSVAVGNKNILYVEKDGKKYLVEPVCYKSSKDIVKDVLAVGDRLFLITTNRICIVNTDMERDDLGRLVPDAYSFDGCRYTSGCSTRLDDCGRMTVKKNTVYGTVVARFKTIIASMCHVKNSDDGHNFHHVCDVQNNRTDFNSLYFDNFAIADDADHIAVIPERSRGWVRKQYYFYSDGFCQPFGLYELSFNYKIAGKIRY